jgi:hypothetical protein
MMAMRKVDSATGCWLLSDVSPRFVQQPSRAALRNVIVLCFLNST